MAEARILIAEDEAIVALDIKQKLECQGYRVSSVVSSAPEAIREATHLQPDLVLMDITLQGEQSGVEAAAWISTHLDVPVIYLTAHADEPAIQEAKATSPFAYILKPLKDHELELAIEMTLQRHAVEQRSRKREQWLAATLSSISDAVLTTDEDGAVTYMNPPAEALTGWAHNEALERDWSDVVSLIDGETGTPIKLSLAAAVEQGVPADYADRVIVAKDGTPTVVDGRITPIRHQPGSPIQGFVLSFRDVSGRRRVERALRKSEERLRNLFEEMPSGIYQSTPDGRILEANPALVRMLGFKSLEDLKERDLHQEGCGPGYPRPDFRRRIEEEGRIMGLESSWTRQDGSTIRVRESARVVRGEDGHALYYEGMVEDITERQRTQAKLERRVAQLALLNDVGERIAATLELDTILDRSTRLVRESFGYHHVALFIVEPEEDEAVLKAGAGDFINVVLPGYRQKVTDGIIGWVARHGETLLVNDVTADPRFVNLVPDALPTRSELSVPIQVRGETVGVLDVQSPERDAFDAGDVTVMETVADQIGLAIWRGRLYEAAQRRTERLAVLNAVSSAVFSSLEPETVMQQVLSMTRQAFQAPAGSILLRDRATGELFFALTSSSERASHLTLDDVRLEPGQGIAGWVVEQDQAVLVDDVRVEPRWYGGVDGVTGFQTRSLMSAPLKRTDEIIGALEIVSDRKAAFTDQDLSLLESLCAIAAIGLDNARLYAAMRSHADRLALLHQLGQAMSATLDYDVVIRSALSKIREIFVADGVWFVEPRGRSGELHLVAALPDKAGLDFPLPLPPDTGIATWAMERGEPVLVQDVLVDARHADHIDQQLGIQTRAIMASPLATTDRLLGIIAVSSQQPGAYGRGDLNTLQAIAATMSMALENAHLYENMKTLLREREATQARLIQSEKMAALGRLLATITHEVNNPLQAIQGCLTLAGEELTGRQRQEKLRRYVEVASSEIEHIADIVRRTRAFYRPEIKGPSAVDVHTMLDSVLRLSNKQLQYSDIVVERDWADGLPKIVANADQLRQVFLNLILNAIDAMPEGGILRVRTSRDHLSGTGQHEPVPAVCIQFADTGEGISPDVASQIFEPFFTTKDDGTGLGLFIAYGAIQAHGGEITTTSEPGQGTTFTVLLPVGPRQDRRWSD